MILYNSRGDLVSLIYITCSVTLATGLSADHDYGCRPTTEAEKLKAAHEYIALLEAKLKCQQIEKFGLERFSSDPDMIRFYTGFTSYTLMKGFFHALSPWCCDMITWSQIQRMRKSVTQKMNEATTSSKLPPIDQLFMFLHKLRLGSLDQDLADKFNISQSTVSRTTITWVNFLYCVLGSQPLWPSRDQIDKAMPDSFKKLYPRVRVTLDCTELKVQSPSSLVLNSKLYSSYKGTTTFKCLVGIAPSGAIIFISHLFPGSMSDKHITRVSGILDLLEEGDEVMADKGFTIDDLLREKNCKLVLPHFLAKKGQFTMEETLHNECVANLRVHVERAIRRCKEYHLFDSAIPLNLAGSINQLWTVGCLLTNFQGPLLQKNSKSSFSERL